MQLAVSKSYRTRDGRLVRITQYRANAVYPYLGDLEGEEVSYLSDGCYHQSQLQQPRDIVAEVVITGNIQFDPSDWEDNEPAAAFRCLNTGHTWHDNGGMMNTYCTVCDADGQWDREVFAYRLKVRTE